MGEPQDTLLLAVGLPHTPALNLSAQHWDEVCNDAGGWEFVDFEIKAARKNEFGGMLPSKNIPPF
jgi:hypothetical protein